MHKVAEHDIPHHDSYFIMWYCCCCCYHACRFGESLDPSEQEWLVWEINQHLADVRGRAPTLDDMPEADRPEVRSHLPLAVTVPLAKLFA